MEIREARHQARNIATRGVHFDGHGNRIAVILHAKDYWQTAVGSRVQSLPKFAFAGGAVAERDVCDFIALKLNVLELTVIAVGLFTCFGIFPEVSSSFRTSHRLQNSSADAGGLGHNIEVPKTPVRGHLASAGTGIVGRAYRAQQHFIRSRAQCQTQRAVAIVRIKPVVSGLQSESGRDAKSFMAGARNLKKNLL